MNNSSPISVWLVIDSLTFGGIESHLLELAKGLKRHNANVKVWLVRRYSHPASLADKLAQNCIPFEYLSEKPMRALPNLLRAIKAGSPSVIHAHGYKASLLCKLAHVATGVKQVTTYHAGETPTGLVKLYDFLDRYSVSLSNHSLAVSRQIQAKIPGQTFCLNNFVDTHNVPRSEGKQIAFVGRLSHEKAPDRFAELAKHHPGLAFDIYGSGPMEQELKDTKLNNVRYHGHQTDMTSVWPKIGTLVICSRYEGLPMIALEAMTRGIIVIALDVGNLSKLINHNDNGFLFDSYSTLATQFRQLLNQDRPTLDAIRQRAINTVENDYSPQSVIPKLLKIYGSQVEKSDFHFDNSSQSKN